MLDLFTMTVKVRNLYGITIGKLSLYININLITDPKVLKMRKTIKY